MRLSHPRGSFVKLLFLILLAGFYLSCASVLTTGKIDFYRSNPKTLLFEVERNALQLNSLKGIAEISVESHQGSYTGRAKILFRKPDSLRIQINAAFGIHAATLLAIGNNLEVYLPRDQILYRSNVKSDLLKQTIGMPIDFTGLKELVTGLPDPFRVFGQDAGLDSTSKKFFWYIIDTKQQRIRMKIDAVKKVVVEYARWNKTTGKKYLYKFSHFVKRKNVRLPLSIQVIRFPEKERLALFYEQIQINENWGRNKFKLSVPERVLVIRMK
ncbi:hypothetical protein BMS3Abin05_01903 [bacterium BMS3Abin05]|nr:hypothetical protein BMS3Abin05_01903 [bacterium BMS3Abin05]GBE27474.1 hypothetical protein BMS3Bbin03_01399 [bacterium BMS3Bbin03]HDZ10990.1 DUF4292 domain-containing protein [Bacteroidota bacterium]